MLALGLTAAAVPAKRVSITVTQPDGTTVTLTRAGDESFHTYLTADGLTVAGDSEAGYRYVTPLGLSEVLAHDAGARSSQEASFLKENVNSLSFEALRAAAPSRVNAPARRATIPGQGAKAAETTDLRVSQDVPCTGSPRIPVLLVAYKDYDFRDGQGALQTYNDFFQKGDKSAHAYFKDQSNGLFTPQFDVYGPITLSGVRKTYGGNDVYGNDKGVGQMVGEACQGLDSSIDFSKYDNDGDGVCDVVIVLYAGDGEASSYLPNSENAVWPCQWYLSSSDFKKSLKLDGVTVDKFAVFNELNGIDTTTLDGVGTVAHEFSHCIGLPDFYATTEYATGGFTMDAWSLMDYGCYNDDGFTPVGYSAFEKYSLGWISLEAPEKPKFYTLQPLNTGNDMALKLNSSNANEYYIIENRQRQGWDTYMDSEGLLITHINYNAYKWRQNTVNNTKPLGYTFVPADNSQSKYSLAGDLWPYGSKDSFTDSSTPAATLNSVSGKLGKPITEMVRHDDGTVSFWFDRANAPAVEEPVIGSDNEEEIEMTRTSFTATWSAPASADETATYSLRVAPWKEPEPSTLTLVGEYDFSQGESADWLPVGFIEYGYSNQPAYKLGSSNKTGGILSPDFAVPEDVEKVTVSITAKAYNSSENTVAVSVLDNLENVVSTETVTLSLDYDTYTVVLDAIPGAMNTIEIATPAKKKRSYVKAASIWTGCEADNTDPLLAPSESVDGDIRIITGITGTSYTISGLEDGEKYEYRVKTHMNVGGVPMESSWSSPRVVDLSKGNSAIALPEAADATDLPAEYFTIQGQRVSGTPTTPGLYIRRQGTAATKVIIR